MKFQRYESVMGFSELWILAGRGLVVPRGWAGRPLAGWRLAITWARLVIAWPFLRPRTVFSMAYWRAM